MRAAAADVAALCLTFGAGFVDAFGYLTLSNVYTANLSGNTVLIAVKSAAGHAPIALLHAYTVGMFLIGLLASGILIEIAIRRRFRRVLAVAMALEAILLIGFTGLAGTAADAGGPGPAGWHLYVLLAIAAVAMGAQNTSLRMAGILSVYTTHVTGAVTRFSEHAVAWVFALIDQRKPSGDDRSHRRPGHELGQALLCAAIWLAFLGGAVLGSYLAPRWGFATLALPITIVILVGLLDCACPLARFDSDIAGRAPRPPARGRASAPSRAGRSGPT
jgi:uncharacterized membrane protein YoaK (UPF0700 family)